MESSHTCGNGLAEHSALPAKLGELVASIAENLEIHMSALDPHDESARKEHEAYLELARQHRAIAAQLEATARRMAGYVDLPMGTHDERALSGPSVREAFARFVKLERELLTLLQASVQRDGNMLAGMGGAPERR